MSRCLRDTTVLLEVAGCSMAVGLQDRLNSVKSLFLVNIEVKNFFCLFCVVVRSLGRSKSTSRKR